LQKLSGARVEMADRHLARKEQWCESANKNDDFTQSKQSL